MSDAMTETAAETGLRTFLIADVRGYTQFTRQHGDEAAARLASTFADLADEAVRAHGGRVVELRGDEALAVFTSSRAAVRAAVDLQRRCRDMIEREPSLPLRVGVGLDAGEAIPVRDGYRGLALNLAARLCSLAAAGEVLISEALAHLTGALPGLEYADRGTAQLKGFSNPVHVIAVLPAESEPEQSEEPETAVPVQSLPIGGFLGALPAGPIAARDDELGRLLSLTDAVAAGGGRTVLLAGEPGVGKTRLAQEVTLEARNRGFLVAAGRCYEAESGVPYFPFLEAFAALFAAAPPEIQREAPRRWPYLGALLSDQIGVPEVGGGQDEQTRIFRAATAFLEAIASNTPVALLLDDLHWADSASLKLLHYLARDTRAVPVLILGTYRDVEVGRQHPLEACLRDLSREGLMERIPVRRMDVSGTAAVMAAAMGEEEISDEFARLVHERTEGNPFFVQQVMQVLVERGDVYRQGERWTRKDIDEIEVPESVRSVIGQRLERLDEVTQEILYEASVLGQAFTFDELQALADRDEQEVERALEVAAAAGLVRDLGRDRYHFDHALTQSALYGELSSRRRRRLHLAAGEVIERLPDRKREGREAELVHHFLEADDPEKALRWAVPAGDAAAAVFAHAEAEWHYRTAAALARELGDRDAEARALEGLGLVLFRSGRFEESTKSLEAALGLRSGDGESEMRIIAHLGRVDAESGQPIRGVERLEPLVEAASAEPPSAVGAQVLTVLSRLYFVCGRPDDAIEVGRKAAEIAERVGDIGTQAEATLRYATAQSMRPSWSGGRIEPMEEAVHLAEEAGRLDVLSAALSNLGVAKLGMLDFRGHVEYRRRALEVAEKIGDPTPITFNLAMSAFGHFYVGEWDEGRRLTARVLPMARAARGTRSSFYALWVEGTHLWFTGRDAEARDVFHEALQIAQEGHDFQALEMVIPTLAETDIAVGRVQEAIESLDSLLASPGLTSTGRGMGTGVLARCLVAAGDIDRALALTEERISWARGSHRMALPLTLIHRGEALARKGEWAASEEALEEAVELCKEAPMPLWEAEALCTYGSMLRRRGDDEGARQRLEESLAISGRLGAVRLVRQAEEELAQLNAG